MSLTDLRRQALRALDNHARRYQVKVPQRLRDFYASAFDQHHHKYAEPSPLPLGYPEDATFRLSLTPPTWLGKNDDAISGPGGEWAAAKHFLPLFVTDQQLFVVADLRSDPCPVGWYAEGSFDAHDGGYADGVLVTSKSLDDFLASLESSSARPEVFRSDDGDDADPVHDDWSDEDFDDDGPRVFDATHDDEDDA